MHRPILPATHNRVCGSAAAGGLENDNALGSRTRLRSGMEAAEAIDTQQRTCLSGLQECIRIHG